MLKIVDLDYAKKHLHIMGDRFDVDLDLKIMMASKLVLDVLKVYPAEDYSPPSDSPGTYEDWETNGAPHHVFALCFLALGELWLKRESGSADVLSDQLMNIIRMYRVPTMA